MLATIDQVSNQSFDYIIVGGGTTGLVVATRLSEDPSVSVLVLEAGAPNLNDPEILIPAILASQVGKPQYDWGFLSVPQANANGKPVYWPRGKGLGGTSSINIFLFHLPAATDINAFEKLGNKGWSWETLKRYYTKVEKFLVPEVKDDTVRFDVREHGIEGPLEVGYAALSSGYEKLLVEALQKAGINLNAEPFAGDTTGTWSTPLTISPRTRKRSYSANMYYEPHASRSNFTVLTSAHVTRTSLSKVASGEATAESVSFIYEGNEYQAFVEKEVIFSAGAIMSPQLLELSGIGDPDVLQNAGVEVVVDLRGVGNNVQEHSFTGITYQVKEEFESDFSTGDALGDPDELQKQTELYHAGERGLFDAKSSTLTFLPLSAISPDAQAVQEKYLSPIQARIDGGDCPPGLRKQYKLQLEQIKARTPSLEIALFQFNPRWLVPDPKKKYATFWSVLNHPFSRGSIHIKSSNPLEHPVIDPHYFEEEYDARSFAETIKFTRRIAQQEPLKNIFEEELFPGPSVQTDEEIIEFLKEHLMTTAHTVGSCSMLPREDEGVVDNKLKVYGTTNVRVMDISIIPLHIAAHPQATAYAIGELGADIIRNRVDF
ncbi:alcohol oxidase [Russula ochroleuca]|uniref:Alcohol oxidase n=1 Tax=Russula ochroleuca TaxID=152965 RepID=A0A9P5N597_9AGAM|nr:alcohol oxidase [Russula ochroleuca]